MSHSICICINSDFTIKVHKCPTKIITKTFHLLVETAQVLPKHFVEYAVYCCSSPTSSFSLSWSLLQISVCTLHKTDHMQDAVEVCHIWSLRCSIMTVKTLLRTVTKGKFAEILNYHLTSILYSKYVRWKMFRKYMNTVGHIINAVFTPTFWSSLHIPSEIYIVRRLLPIRVHRTFYPGCADETYFYILKYRVTLIWPPK